MTLGIASIILFASACSMKAAAPAAMPAMPRPPEPMPTHAAPMPPAEKAEQTGYSDVNTDNSLISNGSVTASSDELLATASAFRREVYRLGGRVFKETVHYHSDEDDPNQPSQAQYRIKILPRLLPDLLDWLGRHSTITAQDVSSIIAMESEGDASIVRGDVQARIGEIDAQLADPS